MVPPIFEAMSKEKKDKKGKKSKKDKKNKQKQQKADHNRLSKLGQNAASLGTALVGAVAAEGAQTMLAKVVEKGAGSDRLDTVRHTIKDAAGAIKNAAEAVHTALDNADASVVETGKALVDKAKDTAEDTQTVTGKVAEDAVDALKDTADGATSFLQQGKKDKS